MRISQWVYEGFDETISLSGQSHFVKVNKGAAEGVLPAAQPSYASIGADLQ